jgi:NAD(P)-dependent dehydrogenase (short-subunit alcohol dehydrogenase family)
MGGVVFDFNGKSVLVTGASRGIGYGIAEGFARAGADLTILADDAPVETAAAKLAALAGRPVKALRCDITDREAVRRAFGTLPRIDVLINNAGLERITPIDEPGAEVEAVFRRIVDINVMGTYFVTRDALPKIPEGGRIIFTSSIWSRTAAAEFGAYVATKHAVLGFMRTLAKELGPRGINVNAVGPGWVRTGASMLSLRRMSERAGRSEQSILDDLSNAQSLPGLMQPADIAELYLFLASDAARNITGQAYGIDRGEVQV